MAKSLQRIEAKRLRRDEGLGYREISKRVEVSKSTISVWCRDIELTVEQIEKLTLSGKLKSLQGRLTGARVQKERRLALIEECNKKGVMKFTSLTQNEFFVAGIALYWAEGYKKGRKVTFCNADPNMITFMINWFINFFNLSHEDFRFRVDINEIHKEREEIVRNYWREIINMPFSQFQKTSFKKVLNKKIYENFNEHYGTLRFEISRPARVIYNLLGYVHGLSLVELSTKELRLRSSVVRAIHS